MVNVTDEASVMQVVNCYFPRWVLGKDMEDEDDEASGVGVGKLRAGAKKGERNTGAKTIGIYSKYLRKFKEARTSKFAILWDKKLQEEAIKQHLLEVIEKDKMKEATSTDKQVSAGVGFDLDICNGCFDVGGMEEYEETDTATVVTEL